MLYILKYHNIFILYIKKYISYHHNYNKHFHPQGQASSLDQPPPT